MHIAAIDATFPSRKLTNQDLLGLICHHSKQGFHGDLTKALSRISALLEYSGARERYWLDKTEKPIDLIVTTAERALQRCDIHRNDVEVLIYVGVDRGFNEPGNAYFVASALGMRRAICFDVLDACMAWSRAVQIIYSLFRDRQYRTALIVNGEFNQTHAGGPGYPTLFALQNEHQIEWTWPGYTVGEAATATLLTSDDAEDDWTFRFSSRTDLADLCFIPLEGYEGYCELTENLLHSNVDSFTSFGSDMHRIGTSEVRKIFQKLDLNVNQLGIIFPHSSSKTSWDEAAKPLGIEHLLFHIYPEYGNLVSASIPAAMALAERKDLLRRGDRAVGWVGSAGMSFGAYTFVY